MYGITKFCYIRIRRNIQIVCLQHLHETLNRLKPGSINRRRQTICSSLLFEIDGSIKDFGSDFIPQPPQQSQKIIAPENVPIDAPVAADDAPESPDAPQKSSTVPTSHASKPYINPFQRAKGGFQLFGRRHSSRP